MNTTIKVPLSQGKFLVAETGGDLTYKEIYIGIEMPDGSWIDLAVVGEAYEYVGDDVVSKPGEYTVKIFDPEDECQMLHSVSLKEPKEEV